MLGEVHPYDVAVGEGRAEGVCVAVKKVVSVVSAVKVVGVAVGGLGEAEKAFVELEAAVVATAGRVCRQKRRPECE